ncbi:MAG: Fic family protein [Patescibacteria group bacterium]|jgi:hypothetical protein
MNFDRQQLAKEKTREYEKTEAAKRPERAEKIIEFLNKIDAFEFFKNLDSNREEIDFEKFKSFLVRLNGIARDIPIKQRKFDGKNVEISGGLLNETILPPKEEDKEEILEFAFDRAKDLSREDNSYMIPAVINELHMFNDGNGRTSRIIHLLLNSRDKESFSENLRKTLGEDGRFDSPDINPSLIEDQIEKHILQTNYNWEFGVDEETGQHYSAHYKVRPMATAEYGEIDKSKKNLLDNLKKYEKVRSADTRYILTATAEAIDDEKYDSILTTNGANKKMLSPIKMESLTQREWNRIFNYYYEYKKEQAKNLVEIFCDPDTYRNPENEQETIKDLFIRRIKEEYETNNKNMKK